MRAHTQDAETAFRTFELANHIQPTSDPSLSVAQLQRDLEAADGVYKYDDSELQKVLELKPWSKDPHYFRHIRISAVALVKMVMHARSGGNVEVMGMIQGKVQDNTMIVMDVFALPVEGTETRVNAQAQAYEYIVQYTQLIKRVGRLENSIGWYHSHPGYGCWLSGIDVSTQMTQQQYQDPFVAIVVDPTRTTSAGKVEIGAFRTYPESFKAPDEGPQEYQTIPLSKIEDFGVHSKKYYPLEISYFKSTMDNKLLSLLWSKYWVNTLSSNIWLANREFITNQVMDLSMKLEQADNQLSQSIKSMGFAPFSDKKKEESQLSKVARDSSKLTCEVVHAMMGQVLKDFLFNSQSLAHSHDDAMIDH